MTVKIKKVKDNGLDVKYKIKPNSVPNINEAIKAYPTISADSPMAFKSSLCKISIVLFIFIPHPFYLIISSLYTFSFIYFLAFSLSSSFPFIFKRSIPKGFL